MVASGTLTQLAAKGPQDLFLTCDAVITFWKGGYRRYTNFAMAEIEQTFNGQTGFGRKMIATIDRAGDLISYIYLNGELDPVTYGEGIFNPPNDVAYWTNSIGNAMIDEVEVQIGGHEFDTHNGEYLEIWESLAAPPEKKLTEMIGFSETVAGLVDYARQSQILYVPLRFWFNRFYEQALPLIALQYHEVKIILTMRLLRDLYIETGAAVGNTSFSNTGIAANPAFNDALLLVSYVYLDTMERRMFAQQAHEYLIDQVQFTGAESHAATTASLQAKLNFNHPTKELIWVCQRDTVGPFLETGGSNDLFNWSGVPVAASPAAFVGETFQTDPFLNAQLQLNGHERTLNHPAIYYRTVQPYQHHTRIPNKHIYSYSFALYPEDVKPSGSCNMSRIDNVVLRFTFPTSGALQWAGQVRIYARSLNVVKIVSGKPTAMPGKVRCGENADNRRETTCCTACAA
jgi:major capsid protein